MYLDFRFPLPASGKLTRQRIRGVTCVNYEYDRVYDKERRFNIPRRATIGKLDSNGMLVPNENCHKYFPGENLPGEKPRSFRSSCLRIGSFLLIRKLSEDYGLPRILGEFFQPRDLGLFLDLTAYSLVCEDNAAQYYPDYACGHPLFTEGMRLYSDSKVSEFLGSVTDDQSIGFLNRWNQGRDCTSSARRRTTPAFRCSATPSRMTWGTACRCSTRNTPEASSTCLSCSSCSARRRDMATATWGSSSTGGISARRTSASWTKTATASS